MIRDRVVSSIKQLLKTESNEERRKRLAAKCTRRGYHKYEPPGLCACGKVLGSEPLHSN